MPRDQVPVGEGTVIDQENTDDPYADVTEIREWLTPARVDNTTMNDLRAYLPDTMVSCFMTDAEVLTAIAFSIEVGQLTIDRFGQEWQADPDPPPLLPGRPVPARKPPAHKKHHKRVAALHHPVKPHHPTEHKKKPPHITLERHKPHEVPSEVPPLSMAVIQRDVEDAEGVVTHMYVDAQGRVAVGIGKVLPTPRDARRLAFVLKDTPRQKATDAEIETEFTRVRRMTGGRPVRFYGEGAMLTLPENEIRRAFRDEIWACADALRLRFKTFDSFPQPAQRALFVMIFGLGTDGLTSYTRLIAAAEAHHWKEAADNCARRGVTPIRNGWTRAMFMAAAEAH